MERTRTFPADSGRLADVRRFVTECARGGPFEPVLDDLLIAVSEASANAVLHSGTAEFRVTWRSEADAVEITVEDDGVYHGGVSLPEIDRTGHRGIHLMAATMNEVALIRGTPGHPGTTVRLVKSLPSRAETA
jgi:anti-sigma regulatory factor (Ser/Thr protein kinase)